MAKTNGKRPAQGSQGPSKKRKLSTTNSSKSKDGKPKVKGKDRASDKPVISIPTYPEDDDAELSDQDIDTVSGFGQAAAFLDSLDTKGISRSKKETLRLHKLNKPVRVPAKDDLPSVDSNSEGEEEAWSSGIEELEDEGTHGESDPPTSDSDAEMAYESVPRRRHPSWDSEDPGVESLPIKLSNGKIQKTGIKFKTPLEEREESEGDHPPPQQETFYRVEDFSTGARFGRRSIVDVVTTKSRKARIHAAKEQIANICQEIVSDPENSLNLLRRLHTFCLPQITTPTHPEPILNDEIIRKLALLSQLAVFKDIIPGYRIRPLTEIEKTEKVSQIVARTRDWEQGLVGIYQQYLRILESELKAKSELADTALSCMCTLLVEVTHFNFRTNLISCVIARLSRKSWDKSSEICLSTLVKVFQEDTTAAPSLEVVRLLNRMIKERRYNVHPNALSCLLYLRLKTELGVRASETHIDKEAKPKAHSNNRAAARRSKGKPTDKPHLSKKAKKIVKEKEEIQKDMREAEVEVDKEERNSTHTETLKLVFVLYFSIIKNPHPTPLLPAALQGISKFAHLVNIDFFRDLLKVLKDLMKSNPIETDDELEESSRNLPQPIYRSLLCISTAFDLLSGQGEALNIDLSDFINYLYTLIPPLGISPDIEQPFSTHQGTTSQSPSDMLFRALNLAFSPRSSASGSPSWRSAAFAKRLLTAALNWPPKTAVRAIEFVSRLIVRDSKLEALLSTEDRSVDGIYRPDVDDPQLCQPFGTSFWELRLLENGHYDKKVQEAAAKVLSLGPNTTR